MGGFVTGVPVSSRVSAKIQQLVNTLKQPRRPPLREFFVDDFDELLEGETLSVHLHDSVCFHTSREMFPLITPEDSSCSSRAGLTSPHSVKV